MKFTNKEVLTIYECVEANVRYESGGCYGDGENITDKKGYANAKKLLAKLNKYVPIIK